MIKIKNLNCHSERLFKVMLLCLLIVSYKKVWAADVHIPDFSVNNGDYQAFGSGITITNDAVTKPLTNDSLKITTTGNANGSVKSPLFIIVPTHTSGASMTGHNLAFWKVKYYVKTSASFTGTYKIVARILDNQDYITPAHWSESPNYGEPFEIGFDNYGGDDTVVNGFTFKNKPICVIPSTHPNNRRTGGENQVEIIIYLENAEGNLWLSDLEITTTSPGGAGFSNAQWNTFESSAGPQYLAFFSDAGQAEYILSSDYCSDLIMDTVNKLFRAVGFNQVELMTYWGDPSPSFAPHRVEIFNSQPDGSGDYEADLDELEQIVDNYAYYGISTFMPVLGTPDWTHPLHNNWGPHNGFANPGNFNGLGDPYAGPQYVWLEGPHWTYPPDHWQSWRDYVSALVTRMKGKVAGYELFMEVNVPSQAALIGGYKAYTEYVKHFYQVAKPIDPNAAVLTGSMDKMLAGCIADGIYNYADGSTFHGYSGNLEPMRWMIESTGNMSHIWCSDAAGLSHEYLWGKVRQQARWSAFTVSEWEYGLPYSILVLQDSEGNPAYRYRSKGWGDRVVPINDYYEFGEISGTLTGEGITAEVFCADQIKHGSTGEAILRATNNSSVTFHNVRLWPVGFVDNLGFDMNSVRTSDKDIAVFGPSEVHEIILQISPTATQFSASGIYQIGLAIINDEGKHSLTLKSVEVPLCSESLVGDFNRDCAVNEKDLLKFSIQWLSDNRPLE